MRFSSCPWLRLFQPLYESTGVIVRKTFLRISKRWQQYKLSVRGIHVGFWMFILHHIRALWRLGEVIKALGSKFLYRFIGFHHSNAGPLPYFADRAGWSEVAFLKEFFNALIIVHGHGE